MKHNGSIYDYAIHKDDIGVYTTLFYVILSQVILPEAKSSILETLNQGKVSVMANDLVGERVCHVKRSDS